MDGFPNSRHIGESWTPGRKLVSPLKHAQSPTATLLYILNRGFPNHLALTVEENDAGNAADLELHGEVFVFFNIALADVYLAFVLLSQFFDGGTESFARTAPSGPKVDDEGLAALQQLLEISACDV